MYIKKIFIIFIIIVISLAPSCFADDILEESELDNFIPVSTDAQKSANEPGTSSKHILALDRKSLTVLYEKDAYSEVPMASTTKIMTAIIVLENCNLEEIVEFSKKAATVHGSTLGVATGTKMSMKDLLLGLMLRSGNDCAIAIAEHVSGSTEEFAKLMNAKAQALNLSHTNFVTPHGLDDNNHYTTAYDLALLTDYALKNETFKSIVSTKTTTISINDSPRTISNTNELLGNLEGVYGVKTGFTFNAGRCLVSCCNRGGLDIIVVVLGADTKNQRTMDSIRIINYIFDNFEYVDLSNYINESFAKYKTYYEENVYLYKTSTVPDVGLSSLENYTFPLKPNSSNLLETNFYTLNTINSRFSIGDKIGCMTVSYDGKILCSLDIVLANEIKQNSWTYYFTKILREFNSSFVL